MSQELLRKFIMYAKSKVHPRLDRVNIDKVAQLFAQLRRETMVSSMKSSYPIVRVSDGSSPAGCP